MDHEVNCTDLQDITDSLDAAIAKAKDGDRVVLSIDQARILSQSIAELWDEVAEHQEQAQNSRKPKFFHVQKPSELYFQPAAIAMVIFKPNGNAMVQFLSGAVMEVEALQWGLMREPFHAVVDLEHIRSTNGLVSA